MPCKCGKVTIPTKKAPAKKAPVKKAAAKEIPKGDAVKAADKKHQPKHQSRASKIATRKAIKNNPYAKGCNCT